MPTLLEKMEANAEARLALPPGVLPAQELARYKSADLERQARQRQLAKEARPNKNSR